MSHFNVAVITDKVEKLEKLLAPYQENSMGDCPEEYLVFNDVEEEYRKRYENETLCSVTRITKEQMRELGIPLDPWPHFHYKDKGIYQDLNSENHVIFISHADLPKEIKIKLERLKPEEISFKRIYASFEDYIEDYAGQEKDPKTGKYGYWENPNKKWDWWEVGGRWSDSLYSKSLQAWTNGAKIYDIDWDYMHKLRKEEAEKYWEKSQDIKEYFKNLEGFNTHAVITPDGKWHENGEMGWFGIVSNEKKDWNEKYFDTFIKDTCPEYFIIIVDCHI